MTVKVGGVEPVGDGFLKLIAVTIRDTVKGKIAGTTYSGPEDLIKGFLETLETNPEYKVKYTFQ